VATAGAVRGFWAAASDHSHVSRADFELESSMHTDENAALQLPRRVGKASAPATTAAAALHPILASAGLTAAADGFALGDTFSFKMTIERAMRRPGAQDELLESLRETWADPSALRLALQPTRAATTGGSLGDAVKDSVVRLLLQCSSVQTALAQQLLQSLQEHQDELDGGAAPAHAGMPLAKLVLSQFRWLETVVDGAALLETLEEILEVAEPPLKRELVLVLPDLVVDGQHTAAVELLARLLREDSQFTAPILESLASLHLDPALEGEVCELVTAAVASSRTTDLPAIIRFLMHHLSAENAASITSALRTGLSAEFLTDPAADGVLPFARANEAATERNAMSAAGAGEALVLDAFLSALRMRSELGGLFLSQLETLKKAAEHTPLDWWLLVALTAAGDAKSKARAAKWLVDRGTKALLRPELLRAAILTHGVALRPHYAVQLQLAAALVRHASSAHANDLGGDVYALLFAEFAEPYERQELICQLLTHAGSGAVREVDAALRVLVALATDDPASVAHFSSFLTGVLDYLDGLSVSQARLAFELFARIAYDAHAGASRLADELQITIRKQLTSTAPRYKSLGVLGGCCLLGRLGARTAPTITASLMESDVGAGAAAPRMAPTAKAEAEALLTLMLKYASGPDGSFGFLLHELSLLVAARAPEPSADGADALGGREVPVLERELIDMIIERITSNFETEYLHDIEALPCKPPPIGRLVPALALSLDGDAARIAVNVLPLLQKEIGDADAPASQRHALSTLSATFQLLRVCEAAVSEDSSNLDAVDAVLGCPLYLFDVSTLVCFEDLPTASRSIACLALFHTVDWLRELVNAFCTQKEHSIRKKVLARLKQLLWMERSLERCLCLTPTFKLPAAIVGPPADKRDKKVAGGTAKVAAAKQAAAAGKAAVSNGKGKAAAAGNGKGKAKAPPPKKKARRSNGSDVDSDEDEEMGEVAEEEDNEEEAEGEGEGEESVAAKGGGGGGGSSAAGDKKDKAKAGPKPSSNLPALTALGRVSAYLRSTTPDACELLTFTSALDANADTEELELHELLTPPSVHYLLSHLHATLKHGLVQRRVGRPGAAPSAAAAAAANSGHDLASMELARLSPAALLQRLLPALLTLRRHTIMLSETIPQVLDAPGWVVDHQAAFGGEEDKQETTRFVEPALLLVMQAMRRLLESSGQLADEASQAAINRVLGHFDDDPAAHAALHQHRSLSQSDSPEDAAVDAADAHDGAADAQAAAAASRSPARACCVTFDFFANLFSNLPSITLQSEVVALCKATLERLVKHSRRIGAKELDERRERLADLASACLQRNMPDDRELSSWSAKAPPPVLVKTLFEVQASYCRSPFQLLHKWTEDILPALSEPAVGEEEGEMCSEECPLFTRKSAPLFIGALLGMLLEEAKRLPWPKVGPRKGKGVAKKAAAVEDADEDELAAAGELDQAGASSLIERLHELFSAFCQLVHTTKIVDTSTRRKDGTSAPAAKTLNKKVITAASKFLALVNKHAVPLMSAHFTSLHHEVCAALKALQPATRLLQVHCTMVKERQQLAALQPATLLKRELEALVFQVKVLLKENNVGEGFWMGNLKHKSLVGHEISSQMAPEVAEPKEPKEPKNGKKRKKKEQEQAEEEALDDADDDADGVPLATVQELDDEEIEEEGEDGEEEDDDECESEV